MNIFVLTRDGWVANRRRFGNGVAARCGCAVAVADPRLPLTTGDKQRHICPPPGTSLARVACLKALDPRIIGASASSTRPSPALLTLSVDILPEPVIPHHPDPSRPARLPPRLAHRRLLTELCSLFCRFWSLPACGVRATSLPWMLLRIRYASACALRSAARPPFPDERLNRDEWQCC